MRGSHFGTYRMRCNNMNQWVNMVENKDQKLSSTIFNSKHLDLGVHLARVNEVSKLILSRMGSETG